MCVCACAVKGGFTHRPSGQLWGVVVDVCDRDEGGGSVGQTKVQVALHVGGLNYDSILGHFLENGTKRYVSLCQHNSRVRIN